MNFYIAIAVSSDGRKVRLDSRNESNVNSLRKVRAAVRTLAARYPNFGRPKVMISTHALSKVPKGWEKAETETYAVESFKDENYSRPRYRIVTGSGKTIGNFKLKREAEAHILTLA